MILWSDFGVILERFRSDSEFWNDARKNLFARDSSFFQGVERFRSDFGAISERFRSAFGVISERPLKTITIQNHFKITRQTLKNLSKMATVFTTNESHNPRLPHVQRTTNPESINSKP